MTTTMKPRTDSVTETPRAERADVAGPATTEEIWKALDHSSFAVVSYVTPRGEPRSSGVVYTTVHQRLYLVVGPDSWKARHIALNHRVSVTVPIRRGGLLTLLIPIPPATISFQADAIVHAPGSIVGTELERSLSRMLPSERRDEACVIELKPRGTFVTYGIGVSLTQMRTPSIARGRAPVATV